MKKVLFINSCIRAENSRTKKIADAFIAELKKTASFKIEIVTVDETNLAPLGRKEYENRENLLSLGLTDEKTFDYAKQFAAADLIVVAAPFWDMGIPAKLKTYFENVSVSNLTFKCTQDGSEGLCRAERMVYITTRGMDIPDGSDMEQASPYLIALCKFFGIKRFSMISAFGLDVRPDDADGLVDEAKIRAVRLVSELLS